MSEMRLGEFLMTEDPNIVGEILRAVAFPGRADHESEPPHHYANGADLREGNGIPTHRLRDLWRRVAGEDNVDEAITDGASMWFTAWGVDVEALVWWDGDGLIAFYLSPGEGGTRVIVNNDSKKVYRWEEVDAAGLRPA